MLFLWRFVCVCRACRNERTKERSKTKRIVSWLVHGATQQHTFSSFPTIRLFSIFHVIYIALGLCGSPLCNRVVYFFVEATTRDIILMISCIFFLLLPALNQKQQQSDATKPILCQARSGVAVCVCIAFSDQAERNFFMLFCYSMLSSVLVWFILRMVVLWRRAFSGVQRKSQLSEKGPLKRKNNFVKNWKISFDGKTVV